MSELEAKQAAYDAVKDEASTLLKSMMQKEIDDTARLAGKVKAWERIPDLTKHVTELDPFDDPLDKEELDLVPQALKDKVRIVKQAPILQEVKK